MSQGTPKPDTNADSAASAELAHAVKVLAATPELIERRKSIRPIPTGEVSESNDPEVWALFAGTTQSFFVKTDPAE